jgi:mannose-6-phosphate isomerase
LADLDAGTSVLGNGPQAGKTLTELLTGLGADLLGQAKPIEGRFPLLLKLLDANDVLSLQVHPDADAVAEIGGGAALKPECWYILESRDGFIYKGLQPGVTPKQFRQALEQDKVTPLLRRFDVKAGDFHYIAAGTVHALGAGVVCAEIQSPSDTTYRVSDWGRGRETHLERSMQCIHFAPAPEPPGADGDVLLRAEDFIVALRTAAGNEPNALRPGRCSAVMITAASAHVEIHHDGPDSPVFAFRGDTVLLPAALRNPRIVSAGRLEYIEVTLPQG